MSKQYWIFICYFICMHAFGSNTVPTSSSVTSSMHCSQSKVLTSQKEIDRFLKEKYKTKEIGLSEVYGFEFVAENPRLLWAFRELATFRSESDVDKKERDLHTNFLENKSKKFNKGTCRNVYCALSILFGSSSLKMLYLMTEFELNTSPYVPFPSAIMKNSELNDILNAISKIPNFHLPLELNQMIVRFSRDEEYAVNNDGLIGNASMMFFNQWSQESDSYRAYSVIHEVGHNIEVFRDKYFIMNNFNNDGNLSWKSLSHWTITKDAKYETDRAYQAVSDNFVSDYAKSNPREDFAESYAIYIEEPELLKRKSNVKYEFLKKNVFDGQEYGPNAKCNRKSEQIIQQVRTMPFATATKLINKEKVAKACFNPLMRNATEFEKCVSYYLTREYLILNGELDEDAPVPNFYFDSLTGEFIYKLQPMIVREMANYIAEILVFPIRNLINNRITSKCIFLRTELNGTSLSRILDLENDDYSTQEWLDAYDASQALENIYMNLCSLVNAEHVSTEYIRNLIRNNRLFKSLM